jgi:hypothetical protein
MTRDDRQSFLGRAARAAVTGLAAPLGGINGGVVAAQTPRPEALDLSAAPPGTLILDSQGVWRPPPSPKKAARSGTPQQPHLATAPPVEAWPLQEPGVRYEVHVEPWFANPEVGSTTAVVVADSTTFGAPSLQGSAAEPGMRRFDNVWMPASQPSHSFPTPIDPSEPQLETPARLQAPVTHPPAAPQQVFVSYAWESGGHREWVGRLAERLRAYGDGGGRDRLLLHQS